MDLADLYQTLPLDETSHQIRLLEIIGGPDTALQCKFHLVSLSNKPEYVALSYAWGEPQATQSIWIDGCKTDIRDNLWLFLCQARKRTSWLSFRNLVYGCGPWKYLWIDALCINQENVREKNAQVQNMAEIYTKVRSRPCLHGEPSIRPFGSFHS